MSEPTANEAVAKVDRFMTAFEGTPTECAWGAVKAELESLRERNTRLGTLRVNAETEADLLRPIVQRVTEVQSWCGEPTMHRAVDYILTGRTS